MADAPHDSPRRPSDRGARVPPHNLDAEASLLGAMLLSSSAIAAAVEIVKAADFYKPAHAHIFDAITSLYGAGEPSDPVTVAEELRRAGLLESLGGPDVLVALQANTPAISNAARYARIVEENALLRRLIGVAGEIAEIGYEMPDDVTKAIDRAESMVFDVAQRRVADSLVPLHDLLDATLNRLEHLYERGEAITGLATGYSDLDKLLAGLQPSSLVVVGARPSMGKCVAWDTPIVDPTTGGVCTAAEMYRRGEAGQQVVVASLSTAGGLVAAEPSAFIDDGIKPVFRVRTASGREVRITATHPLLTERGWQPLAALRPGVRIAVPRALPFFGSEPLPEREVVVLAHLVGHGALTNGVACFTNTAPTLVADLVRHAQAEGVAAVYGPPAPDAGFHPVHPTYRLVYRPVRPDFVTRTAHRHGLFVGSAQRRIPDAVFRLPREQLALFLSRLFAMGSWARAAARGCGRIRFSDSSPLLIHGVQHLLLRFGVGASVSRRRMCTGGVTSPVYDLELTDPAGIRRFCETIGIFSQERSVSVLAHRAGGAGSGLAVGAGAPWPRVATGSLLRMTGRRAGATAGQVLERVASTRALQATVLWDEIVDIAYDGLDQVYDLTVPATHNFVAGDVFVHNTAFALGMATHAVLENSRPVLFFSLEMSHLELSQRILCAEAKVDSTKLRTGRLAEADWTRISHALGRLAEAQLFIDDNPNITVMEIRAKARRLKSRVGDLGLVVVDYLQLMSGRQSAENRQVEVAEISRGLKILARELETPVVALSQLSRNLESRGDKRPMLADLRESGSIEQDADVVMFIYRDEVYNPESPDIGTAEIHVAKHRNGPNGLIRLAFLGHYTRFANMATDV